MVNPIMVLGVGISVLWSLRILHAYAEPHVWHDRRDRWVLALCFCAYVISWVPVWLLPFDLIGLREREDSGKRCSETEYSWLQFQWMIIYIINLSAGYLSYDFARSYLDAGGFSIQRNIRLALVAVVQWYSVAILIAVAVIGGIAYGTQQMFEAELCEERFLQGPPRRVLCAC